MDCLKTKSKEDWFRTLVCVFFFARMIWNFCILSEKEYDTIRNYFYCRALFDFFVVLLVVNKTKIFNKFNIIFGAVSAVLISCYLYSFRNSPDLLKWFAFRWTSVVMGIILLVDLIRRKKIPKWNERNGCLTILYLIANISAFCIEKGSFHTQIPLWPFAIVFCMRLTEKEWKKFLHWFTAGYYVAFVIIMMKSFILVPYTGERYSGVFVNHGLFGIFIGGAALCALFWGIEILHSAERKKISVILVIAALLFALVCSVIVMTKTAVVGFAVGAWLMFVLYPLKSRKGTCWKRFLISALAGIAVVSIALVFLFFLKDIRQETVEALFPNSIIQERILYWVKRGETFFCPEVAYVDSGFKEGSFINFIDRITSTRLSFCIVYLRRLNLWGHPILYLVAPSGLEFSYPHCVFVDWLYLFGVPIGGLHIVWFLTVVVMACREVYKRNAMCILPMLWMVYMAICMAGETVYWNIQVGFCTLILMYPLMVRGEQAQNSSNDKSKKLLEE